MVLSGHVAIGPYLRDKIHKAADPYDKCWWCGEGKADPLPPFHGVQGLAPSDHEAVERYREGVWVEIPKSPLSQVAVGGEGHGGGFGVLRGHQCGVHQRQKGAPGGGM